MWSMTDRMRTMSKFSFAIGRYSANPQTKLIGCRSTGYASVSAGCLEMSEIAAGYGSTQALCLDEIDGVRSVYENIPITGACLDVGGLDARRSRS
jgi:hypothetical protein